ncbi:winged helix-turn-helix domain-containing protein [Acuticoccus sp. M5D2P5]|uniref:ArsR/SmtB family transcription factor n=1 Tax=Acuticoccus kalidii TaxID=2910977 RepID=UPI001F2AC04C|nr:winged helix-turn-helix domain-containing protein [Acuticoccus kalidii]MCF3933628.1 winged helix-turn-helix domain-containing protein [Acuticoccus kalidii]
MKEGPDIARIGALIGDPARANMLTALMSGKALTVTELSAEAGVTLQTASAHLAKLEAGGFVAPRKQGRHKYYALAGDAVVGTLEALMGLAADKGHLRTRTGPRDPALREARVCYNHLAGDMGVRLYRSLLARGHLRTADDGLTASEDGIAFAASFGIDIAQLTAARAPLCRECLDWSERRSHLAGALGRAFLAEIYAKGWAARVPDSRIVRFTPSGRAAFQNAFPVPSETPTSPL